MSAWYQLACSRRYIAPVTVFCMGVALSYLAFTALRNEERQDLKAHFEHAAEDRISAVTRELEGGMRVLQSLKSFFASSHKVERNEFKLFVEPFFLQQPELQALQWIPRVPEAELTAYEEAAKLDGLPDFQISEVGAEGRIIPVKKRHEYYPVYFVEPYVSNELSLGFDLGSDPVRLETLIRACDTGNKTGTALITLIQDTTDQLGMLVFLPIYSNSSPADSIKDRRENLEGFAVAVYRIGDIVEMALAYLEPQGIDVHLYDISLTKGKSLLYFHSSRMRNIPEVLTLDKKTFQSGPFLKVKKLAVAGREWSIVCTATPQFIAVNRGMKPWGILAIGLIITGMLVIYLVDNSGRAIRLTESKTRLEHEIVQRKQAEESNMLQSCALTAAANAIIITDCKGCISWVNPAFTRLTGYSAQEAIGRNTNLLNSGKQDRQVYNELWQTIAAGNVWQGELINQRKDGTHYTEEMTITPVSNNAGDITHFIAIKQDITDRKQAQEESLRLIQIEHERNHLKAAVTAQEQLLGVVGHELRTPLAALRITSELLLTDGARQIEDRDLFLQSINDETIRMSRMVDNLLEAARLNNGTARWNWGTVRLKEVCQTALDEIRPLVLKNASNVQLECCVEPANLIIKGDADAIWRLVLNLVSNAHKNTSEGSICVSVRLLDEVHKPRIEIKIQDTGHGISKNIADRLGIAFALNAGVAGASYTKGTGLGLAICKGIVAAHGGTMSIQSAQGKGTTITVRLRTDLAKAVANSTVLTIEKEIAA